MKESGAVIMAAYTAYGSIVSLLRLRSSWMWIWIIGCVLVDIATGPLMDGLLKHTLRSSYSFSEFSQSTLASRPMPVWLQMYS